MSDIEHKKISVSFPDGNRERLRRGIPVRQLLRNHAAPNGLPVIAALANHEVVSLNYRLDIDTRLQWITLADRHGRKVYRRSLTFLLAKTVKDLFPEADLYVEHSLGNAFFCTFEQGGEEFCQERLDAIETRMRELIEADLPIERRQLGFEDTLENLNREGQWDKHGLLDFRNPPKVVVYHCDGFTDLAHAPLADRTGPLGLFELACYENGFVILFPDKEKPPYIQPFRPQPHLFQIFKAHKEWGRTVGVRTISQLNNLIMKREIDDFIRVSEATHEKEIARLADQIAAQRDSVRFVLIAGPSSSGKTTFAKRLAVQLKVNGIRPLTLSADDYFHERKDSPLDAEGKPDFEHVETIDLDLLHQQLLDLVQGKRVITPRFDFHDGHKIFDEAHAIQLKEQQMIIMEGIHCLNPLLSHVLPDPQKFKIYISALTQLNLDKNNRISTTDNRLLRRMVRDHQFRGHSGLDTLRMWPSVRRGEDRWIFPFQEQADAAFNSALDFELAVLRPLAEPLLAEVRPSHPEYAEARRLQDFLQSLLSLSQEKVSANSLLREFIGRSSFSY